MRDEKIDKFCFSHLNYAGRGNIHRSRDAQPGRPRATRSTCSTRRPEGGLGRQRAGTSSPATTTPTAPGCCAGRATASALVAGAAARAVVAWGGNASGVNAATSTTSAWCAPTPMWWHHNLGGVRERTVPEIWMDTLRPADARPEDEPRPVGGRCASAATSTSAAATRARARAGDRRRLGADPGCYLSDERDRPRRGGDVIMSCVDTGEAALVAAFAIAADMAKRPGRNPRRCTASNAWPATASSASAAWAPALLPQSLQRLRPAEATRGDHPGRRPRRCRLRRQALGRADRRARRVDLHAGDARPGWTEAQITPRAASSKAPRRAAGAAVWKADPLNVFVVVEAATTMSPSSTATGSEPSTASPRASRCGGPILARWPLRLLRLARRLDHQVRPVEPHAWSPRCAPG